MPQRDLVWSEKAIEDLRGLLERRDDRDSVLLCVEGHLLAVADNPAIASTHSGPQAYQLYRFGCRDGETALYLQAVFQDLPDGRLSVMSCNTTAL